MLVININTSAVCPSCWKSVYEKLIIFLIEAKLRLDYPRNKDVILNLHFGNPKAFFKLGRCGNFRFCCQFRDNLNFIIDKLNLNMVFI